MARRGENIRKRKDGYWEGRYISEYTVEGKAKYISIYRKTYSEVKEALKQAKGTKTSNKGYMTFKDVSIEWLTSTKISIKPSTYAKYNNTVYQHIIPDLGNIQAKKINKAIIDKFVLKKYETGRLDKSGGLSAKTVIDMVSILKQILKFAEQEKNIYINNFDIKKPKNEEKTIKILSKDEQEKLINHLFLNTDNVKMGFLICLYMGIRIGELCALTYGDINISDGIISINKTMQRMKNLEPNAETKTKIVIDKPKSKKSIRDIPIPNIVLKKLQELYHNNPKAYLLTGKSNQFIEPRLCEYKFDKCLHEVGINHIKFHALRHTFATKALESQTDVKTLSNLLGHADVAFTLKTYVHPTFEIKKLSIENTALNY